eukprot:RCo047842
MELGPSAPVLNVVPVVTEVWESYVVLRLARFATGVSFNTYHLSVTGPDYRFDQHLISTADPVKVTDLSAGTAYTVGVRGQLSDGCSWTAFTELSVTTAFPMKIEAAKVGETFLQVRWLHGASTEVLAPVVRYQLEVVSKQFVLATEVYNGLVEKDQCAGGTFTIDYLKPNHAYFARARPQTADGTWGAWCEETRLLTIKNVYIMPEEVGETYVCVQWCRTGGKKLHDPTFHEEDCLIKRFHLRVWEAGPRHKGAKLLSRGHRRPWFRYETVLEEPAAFTRNVLRVTKLLPNRIYLARAKYLNVLGDWSEPLYFRFSSMPAISINAVKLLTTDQIHVAWVRDPVRDRGRDNGFDAYDDGSQDSYGTILAPSGSLSELQPGTGPAT